jgi:hypothetical protein
VSAQQFLYWENEIAGIMRGLGVTGRIDTAVGRLAALLSSVRRVSRRP